MANLFSVLVKAIRTLFQKFLPNQPECGSVQSATQHGSSTSQPDAAEQDHADDGAASTRVKSEM